MDRDTDDDRPLAVYAVSPPATPTSSGSAPRDKAGNYSPLEVLRAPIRT